MDKKSIDSLFRVVITLGVLLSLLGSPAVGNYQVVLANENSAPLLTDMGTLIEDALLEETLTVIALPDNWCNYGALIDGFEDKYQIVVNSVLPDGSSAEELQAIRDVRDGVEGYAPDVIDVGVSFAQIAKEEGLITPYQVDTWETIPAFMKDDEGYWYGDYYGVMSIAANTTSFDLPETWADLLTGSNVGQVALGGDPIYSNKAFFGVYAAALGNGGTLDDIEPGISFFRDLNAAGRFLPDGGGEDSLVSGETPVLLEWSYNALTFRDAHPESSIEVVIPGPSPIASYYAQAISAYAPHPNAAKLWMEYLYSDEGQLAFLEGYCFPARYDDLLDRKVIPVDMLASLPDISGAEFPSLDQIEVAKNIVDHKWTCTVYGNCPWMRVNHVSDQLDAWNWPYPGHLALSIEKLEGEDLYMDMEVSPGEEGNPSTWFDLGEYDIEVGDEITLTDGFTTKEMRVIDLSIDSVNIDSNIVTGRVEPSLSIRLSCPNDSETNVTDEDGDGFWEVDLLTGCGFDLVPGAMVIAEVYDIDGDLTTVGWYIPNPHFTIFPEWEWFDGLDWPDESRVNITVVGKPECEILDVPGGGFFNGGFPEGCDIATGDIVTFSDGDTIREHQVRNLYVTDVDISENTVTGISNAEETVYVSAHDGGFEPLIVTAAESGVWQVNLLAEAGYTISDDSEGRSEIRDEMGNATASDWHVTHPHFTVFPEWEFFDGLDWPNGAIVEITVSGKDECATEKESWGYFFNGNFGEGCNIEFGDEITFTDGTTTRTHTVRNLYVTNVNVADNTVSGKADASEGTIVYVWPHDPNFVPLEAIVDENGDWEVNLLAEADYTLRDDSEGRSEIRDEMGNATASDWHVTHPHFTVFPEWEWFDGLDWPNGAIVEITVSGKDECATEKESWGYFFNGNFGEGCDLEIGDTVTFSDGKTSQEHIVQNLTVTKANQDDNTIKGTALPGAEVFVWSHATGEEQLAIAKKTGKWLVDFNDFYDLVPGECGRSEVRVNIDDSGYYNSTAVDWCISYPRIVASESGDWFWTTDFKPGDLNISIYDTPDEGANLLWSGEQVTDEWGFTFVGSDIHGLDLAPGNFLIVSDGDSQKSLVLQPISVTMFDTINDIMNGYAPAGMEVLAAAGPQDWQERIMVQADPTTGYWFADFASIGFDITVDMQPWSFAQTFDDDGDANEGNPPPFWIVSYTSNRPFTLDPGEHTYQFFYNEDPAPESPKTITVSDEAGFYDGYVLLRPLNMRTCNEGEFQIINEIRTDQPTLFNVGYVPEYTMTYEGAQVFFDSLTVQVTFDDEWVTLEPSEIMPYNFEDWKPYQCGLTYPPSIPWRDDFDGSLAREWYWVNENPENWNIVDNSSLRINTSMVPTGAENLLLLPVSNGDFTIETQLTFTPTRNYQIAGLVIWQDSANYLQFGRAFCDVEDFCVNNGMYFDMNLDGEPQDGNFAVHDEAGEIYIRLVRDGENIHALDSSDGETWNYIGTHSIPADFHVNAVGLTSAQDFSKEETDEWTPAEFEYFQLSESDPPPLEWWIVSYTSDRPFTLDPGDHTYQFFNYEEPATEGPLTITVSDEADFYDGYVLLRQYSMKICNEGSIEDVTSIRPDQAILFSIGYVPDNLMTYEGAQAYFDSLNIQVALDDLEMISLVPSSEIMPYTFEDWQVYLCGLTLPE